MFCYFNTVPQYFTCCHSIWVPILVTGESGSGATLRRRDHRQRRARPGPRAGNPSSPESGGRGLPPSSPTPSNSTAQYSSSLRWESSSLVWFMNVKNQVEHDKRDNLYVIFDFELFICLVFPIGQFIVHLSDFIFEYETHYYIVEHPFFYLTWVRHSKETVYLLFFF